MTISILWVLWLILGTHVYEGEGFVIKNLGGHPSESLRCRTMLDRITD